MVDTGAMVSIVQPEVSKAQVQARGVTGTELQILGEQTFEFELRNEDLSMVLTHTFIVSPLKRCSSGILGMDFLQSVGAEISLTSRSLIMDRCSFPLTDWKPDVPTDHRLINGGKKGSEVHNLEERNDEDMKDWVGAICAIIGF
jgi:hypothetical protein